MPLSEIEKILYDAMGLNAASIGSSAVMSAVEQRMIVCNINDIINYKKKLNSDKNELQELVEEVVVAETWFFRDMNPFKMLTRFIKEEWLPSKPGGAIRILSLPCATGEEPYSIAITLIEAGLMPSQLKIDAFDISERNIKRCKSACYPENSFRGVDPYIRDRFFNSENKIYYPDILIKAMVNFEMASVLDPLFAATQIPYDIVFCRNLLIYFDRDTQAVANTMLGKLLTPKGLLFVGHAETSIFSKSWYLSELYQKSYIVRKFSDGKKVQKKLDTKKTRNIRPVIKNNTRLYNKKPRTGRSSKNIPVNSIQNRKETENSNAKNITPGNDLVVAKKLADSGNFIEAEKICIAYLENNKQDKEVYFLLAIIQLANGNEQKSIQYFKNIIYLEPNHYDSLMYLSTLLGDEGDEIAAARYRDRALRVKNKIDLKRENV